MDYNCFGTKYKNVSVKVSKYLNGNTAVHLSCEGGEPLLTASVNIVGHRLPEGQFFCKAWSENEGIDIWLQDNEIAKHIPGHSVKTGFVTAELFELIKKD